MTDGPKLPFVLRVRLDAQAGREDELAHRGAEAGEEGVEGLFMREEKTQRTSAYHSFIHSFIHASFPARETFHPGAVFLFPFSLDPFSFLFCADTIFSLSPPSLSL